MHTNCTRPAPQKPQAAVKEAAVPGSFFILLVCPRCYRSKWLRLEGVESTATDLLNTYWDFACPVHGPQHEKPLQVDESSPCLYQLYQSKNNLNRR